MAKYQGIITSIIGGLAAMLAVIGILCFTCLDCSPAFAETMRNASIAQYAQPQSVALHRENNGNNGGAAQRDGQRNDAYTGHHGSRASHEQSGNNNGSSASSDSASEGSRAANPVVSASGVSLTLTNVTSVLRHDSQYKADVILKNTTSENVSGIFSVNTRAGFTFASALDMQHWAENTSIINARDMLFVQYVHDIPPNSTKKIHISVDPTSWNNALATWGAKPIRLNFIKVSRETIAEDFKEQEGFRNDVTVNVAEIMQGSTVAPQLSHDSVQSDANERHQDSRQKNVSFATKQMLWNMAQRLQQSYKRFTNTDKTPHVTTIPTFVTRVKEQSEHTATPPLQMALLAPIFVHSWNVSMNKVHGIINDGVGKHIGELRDLPKDNANNSVNTSTDNQLKSNNSNEKSTKNSRETSQKAATNNEGKTADNHKNHSNDANGDSHHQSSNTTHATTSTVDARTHITKYVASLFSPSIEDKKSVQSLVKLAKKYSQIQTIASNDSVQNFTLQTPQAFAQPMNYDFSIASAFSARNHSEQARELANILDSVFPDQTIARSALGNTSMPIVALSDGTAWNEESLGEAARLGYNVMLNPVGAVDTVVDTSLVTNTQNFHTDHGNAKIIFPQETLSTILQGKATSDTAIAEQNVSGQVARFVAQTALYQSSAPYASRVLAVTVDNPSQLATLQASLEALQGASWIHWSSIHDLLTAPQAPEETYHLASDDNNGDNNTANNNIDHALQVISNHNMLINRFINSIMLVHSDYADSNDYAGVDKNNGNHADSADSNATSNTEKPSARTERHNSSNKSTPAGDTHDGDASNKSDNVSHTNRHENAQHSTQQAHAGNHDSSSSAQVAKENADDQEQQNNDPSALARQEASRETRLTVADARHWITAVRALQTQFSQHILANNITSANNRTLIRQNSAMVKDMYDDIAIASSDTVTTLSESGNIPVAVSNRHPFTVKIKIFARSSSPAIQVSQEPVILTVEPQQEAQATFPVKVLNSVNTDITFQLEDMAGTPFGVSDVTKMHSLLRLNDFAGYVIVVLTMLLFGLGLYRQLHRKDH